MYLLSSDITSHRMKHIVSVFQTCFREQRIPTKYIVTTDTMCTGNNVLLHCSTAFGVADS